MFFLQDHLITHKQSLTKVRRKLPQINQNFKGSTFKDGDQNNGTNFIDSSCTLPVSRSYDIN